MLQLQDLVNKRRLSIDFIGRDEELDLLLQTVNQEEPLVVFIHGLAGIGKSTLLDAFARRARVEGATVISRS